MTALMRTLVTSAPLTRPRADADGERAGDAEPDRQALIGHEADHDQADEACHEADAEIELADDEGIGQSRGDDRVSARLG